MDDDAQDVFDDLAFAWIEDKADELKHELDALLLDMNHHGRVELLAWWIIEIERDLMHLDRRRTH